MMNKFFILLLILAVLYVSFPQTASAGWFKNLFGDTISNFKNRVINSVIAVVEVVVALTIFAPGAILETITGTDLNFKDSLDSSMDDSSCRLGSKENTTQWYAGNCDNTSGTGTGTGTGELSLVNAVNATDLGACTFQIPITFYNSIQTCTTNVQICTATSTSSEGEFCSNYVNQTIGNPSSDGRKVALYRFTLPSSVSNSDLTNWFISQINQKIGNGVTAGSGSGGGGDIGEYWTSGSDEKLTDIDYSQLCDSSGVCKFTDKTIPENSYIAYAMKILGDGYGIYQSNPDYVGFGSGITCVMKDNKFFSPNSSKPAINFYYGDGSSYGFAGPYKSGSCPPTIGYLNSPAVVELPDSINVNWGGILAIDSLTASGDWSGSKSLAGGTEQISKPRGDYTFTLTGVRTATGQSTSKTTATQVIQVPKCSFSSNPSAITPPQSATISWNCNYANSCSIDNGISSVSRDSGSVAVRPTQGTTYTLTCDGLDGTRYFKTTVGIKQAGRIRYEEVAPR